MARDMNKFNAIPGSGGKIEPRVIITIVVAAVIVLGAAWFFTRPPAPQPIPEPTGPAAPIERVAPAESPVERGDTARELINELTSRDDESAYAEAYERARGFRAEGRLADAQLLYFFAARGGHAPAAFDLATFYDPVHYAETQSLMDEPDPFQAYRWYREAESQGDEAAGARLSELRAWAEDAADNGDAAAERLLLQWE